MIQTIQENVLLRLCTIEDGSHKNYNLIESIFYWIQFSIGFYFLLDCKLTVEWLTLTK